VNTVRRSEAEASRELWRPVGKTNIGWSCAGPSADSRVLQGRIHDVPAVPDQAWRQCYSRAAAAMGRATAMSTVGFRT
jgi:hypothetical protein